VTRDRRGRVFVDVCGLLDGSGREEVKEGGTRDGGRGGQPGFMGEEEAPTPQAGLPPRPGQSAWTVANVTSPQSPSSSCCTSLPSSWSTPISLQTPWSFL
jgi:hypothetical protein